MSASPSLTVARRTSGRSGLAAAWLIAVPLGGVAGAALGYWCRRHAGQPSAAGVLADIGAPWILAAFAAGAATMVLTGGRRASSTLGRQLGSGIAGALAGSTCLVAATIVYYGPARTGRLDPTGAGSATAVWAAVGLAVGLVFGAFGAWWRSAPSRWQAAACLAATGLAITAEAVYLLDAGVGAEPVAREVLVLVAAAGVALPLLAGRLGPALVGALAVALLALPGSLVAEVVWRGALGGVAHLRYYVARA
jgi:hypothetical protein